MAPVIDEALASRLVAAQFPQWRRLSIEPVETAGWDNRTFRLGENMIVRLPRAAAYAAQVEKEHRWLPKLAPLLPLQIPTPLAIGEPAEGYPWKWSVYRWIEGETAAPERIGDLNDFATDLAEFLIALQRIDTMDGPRPGPHNFYRGGSLMTYDAETRQAIAVLNAKLDTQAATEVWEMGARNYLGPSPGVAPRRRQRRKSLDTRGPLERYHRFRNGGGWRPRERFVYRVDPIRRRKP